jgi:hypothetical protein
VPIRYLAPDYANPTSILRLLSELGIPDDTTITIQAALRLGARMGDYGRHLDRNVRLLGPGERRARGDRPNRAEGLGCRQAVRNLAHRLDLAAGRLKATQPTPTGRDQVGS